MAGSRHPRTSSFASDKHSAEANGRSDKFRFGRPGLHTQAPARRVRSRTRGRKVFQSVRTGYSVEGPRGGLRVVLRAGLLGGVVGILLLLYLGGAIGGVHGWRGDEDGGRGRDCAGYLQSLVEVPQSWCDEGTGRDRQGHRFGCPNKSKQSIIKSSYSIRLPRG